MEDYKLELYNFCREYIRLYDLDNNLFDLGFEADHKYRAKCREELKTIEHCIMDEIREYNPLILEFECNDGEEYDKLLKLIKENRNNPDNYRMEIP